MDKFRIIHVPVKINNVWMNTCKNMNHQQLTYFINYLYYQDRNTTKLMQSNGICTGYSTPTSCDVA